LIDLQPFAAKRRQIAASPLTSRRIVPIFQFPAGD
jgi:hypothetical protein